MVANRVFVLLLINVEELKAVRDVDQWFEVLDGLLGPYWKAAGLAFNCTFLLFGTVIQLIACARFVRRSISSSSSLTHPPIALVAPIAPTPALHMKQAYICLELWFLT
jgi:hypothetical protein